jgi:hypothetical protein
VKGREGRLPGLARKHGRWRAQRQGGIVKNRQRHEVVGTEGKIYIKEDGCRENEYERNNIDD